MSKKLKKCNHIHKTLKCELFVRFCADGTIYNPVIGTPDPICWKCLNCNAYFSLGEANDNDPNVQVEIMAARIAADMATAGHVDKLTGGWQFGWWLYDDEEASLEQGSDRSFFDDGTFYNEAYLSDKPNWPAGWLARVIDKHEQ